MPIHRQKKIITAEENKTLTFYDLTRDNASLHPYDQCHRESVEPRVPTHRSD